MWSSLYIILKPLTNKQKNVKYIKGIQVIDSSVFVDKTWNWGDIPVPLFIY